MRVWGLDFLKGQFVDKFCKNWSQITYYRPFFFSKRIPRRLESPTDTPVCGIKFFRLFKPVRRSTFFRYSATATPFEKRAKPPE